MKHLTKIALVLLAAGTWWLAFMQEPSTKSTTDSKAHKVDYYLKDFTVLSMAENGKPKQRLKAKYMEHFADDDTTELTLPEMTMFSPGKPEINIYSETGYVSSDAELLLLRGAVSILRKSTKDLEPMRVNTRNLRVQIPNDFAETDEFVEIFSGNNTIEGIGLRAHFREPINIKILADVRGKHVIK